MKTFFKKPEYCFLAESTTIEDASFPYKTAISEANVKANKMVTTKWTKNGVFSVTNLFFWKLCFSLRTSCKELIRCTNNPNAYICTLYKCWSFTWRCFFPVSILKLFSDQNFPKRELPFENGKIALVHASMVVTYYIKLFRTRAERHNGILMSLLLLVAETIILFDAELSVEKVRCGRVTLIEVLNNYGLVKLVIFTIQKNEVLR